MAVGQILASDRRVASLVTPANIPINYTLQKIVIVLPDTADRTRIFIPLDRTLERDGQTDGETRQIWRGYYVLCMACS